MLLLTKVLLIDHITSRHWEWSLLIVSILFVCVSIRAISGVFVNRVDGRYNDSSDNFTSVVVVVPAVSVVSVLFVCPIGSSLILSKGSMQGIYSSDNFTQLLNRP